ncbi:squalene/phytoene synthase family protein [Flexivirga sp. ID2601S]|uniref:Squalene/phytoene synthase family protein n=1 Tax=Flexivirga aerilata TaxID=1656889 RepID=A0A849ANT3_9MICO|nr:squalene/phytoene synthase family protein [Flexivirga aerilata]NNG38462.1 squalene/phytoene synthase family protein [Flexivirga aerilata]
MSGPPPPTVAVASDDTAAPDATTENFPVALRILPARHRDALLRSYDVARHIDQLGDAAAGDRVAALLAFRADLHRLRDGAVPHEEVLRRATPVIRVGVGVAPFDDLIEANLIDQQVARYADFAALLDYCSYSAHPIGRLVLAVFGQSTDSRIRLSDNVCAALQVLEHCQDVVEDHAAGRIYLPQDDLLAAGVDPDDLLSPHTHDALKHVVLQQVQRSRTLLEDGPVLIGELRGWGRVAVAGYVAGGLATADALERAGGDVTGEPVRPRRIHQLRQGIRLLLRSRGRR